MKYATVDPVPTPIIEPGSTYSMAFSAASRLASDMFRLLEGKKVLVLLCGHREDGKAVATTYQGKFFAEFSRVLLDLVQRDAPAQFAFEAYVHQLPAWFLPGRFWIEIWDCGSNWVSSG